MLSSDKSDFTSQEELQLFIFCHWSVVASYPSGTAMVFLSCLWLKPRTKSRFTAITSRQQCCQVTVEVQNQHDQISKEMWHIPIDRNAVCDLLWTHVDAPYGGCLRFHIIFVLPELSYSVTFHQAKQSKSIHPDSTHLHFITSCLSFCPQFLAHFVSKTAYFQRRIPIQCADGILNDYFHRKDKI